MSFTLSHMLSYFLCCLTHSLFHFFSSSCTARSFSLTHFLLHLWRALPDHGVSLHFPRLFFDVLKKNKVLIHVNAAHLTSTHNLFSSFSLLSPLPSPPHPCPCSVCLSSAFSSPTKALSFLILPLSHANISITPCRQILAGLILYTRCVCSNDST